MCQARVFHLQASRQRIHDQGLVPHVRVVRLAHARSAGELDWLGRLSDTLYTEALDDRFVAALDLGPDRNGFRIAYLARAVSPGKYRAPPPQVEDMYKPAYRALGESGWLRVKAAP